MGGEQDAVFSTRFPDPRDKKNEPGQGAHKEGVDYWAPHRDQALADLQDAEKHEVDKKARLAQALKEHRE